MELVEFSEICSLFDYYFDEVEFAYKSENLIHAFNIQNFNFSILQNEKIIKSPIKPFFLCQTTHDASLLHLTYVKSEINKCKSKKMTWETQIDIEPKYELSELDSLYAFENEKFSHTNTVDQNEKEFITTRNKNLYTIENEINNENREPDLHEHFTNSQFFQKFSSLPFDEFSRILSPAITRIPAEYQSVLIQNMYNRIRHYQ